MQLTLTPRQQALRRLEGKLAAEAGLPLQPETHSRLLVHPTPTGKGTVVLLHGWSAATYQYDEMAALLHAKGYDVYVPRLVGHGFRTEDGRQDSSKMVKAGEAMRYRAFGDEVYEDVKDLGQPLQVVGLSGGGNIALDMATRHPDIKGAVVMAPFLGSADGRARAGHHLMRFLDFFTFGLAGRLLEKMPHDWGKRPPDGPGHWNHTVGGIYALACYGDTVVADMHRNQVPLQFILTDADKAARNKLAEVAHERSGGSSRNGMFRFPASEEVPHPMVSIRNNKNQASIDRLTAVTVDFLENGKLSNQP